jgi:hypothetical protein
LNRDRGKRRALRIHSKHPKQNIMKNLLLSTAIAVAATLSTNAADAQNGFTFSKASQTYTRLSGATSLTKGQPWTSDSTYEAPIGFSFKMNGTPITKVMINGGNFIGTAQGAKQTCFLPLGAALMDRGILLGTARSSDIRYQTTGTTGSRIFKLEVANAGFEDEYFNNGELKDSISFQVWFYEGSNATEFRYGTSMVNYFSDYFGPQMTCGFMQNMDTTTMKFDKFYVVNGSSASPTLDSTTTIPGTKGLNAVPADGTVFRFVPKSTSATGVNHVSAGELAEVFPTQCNGTLFIRHSNPKPLSYLITDMSGRIVSNGTVPTGKSAVDLSGAAAGTYTIRLLNAEADTYEVQQLVRL